MALAVLGLRCLAVADSFVVYHDIQYGEHCINGTDNVPLWFTRNDGSMLPVDWGDIGAAELERITEIYSAMYDNPTFNHILWTLPEYTGMSNVATWFARTRIPIGIKTHAGDMLSWEMRLGLQHAESAGFIYPEGGRDSSPGGWAGTPLSRTWANESYWSIYSRLTPTNRPYFSDLDLGVNYGWFHQLRDMNVRCGPTSGKHFYGFNQGFSNSTNNPYGKLYPKTAADAWNWLRTNDWDKGLLVYTGGGITPHRYISVYDYTTTTNVDGFVIKNGSINVMVSQSTWVAPANQYGSPYGTIHSNNDSEHRTEFYLFPISWQSWDDGNGIVYSNAWNYMGIGSGGSRSSIILGTWEYPPQAWVDAAWEEAETNMVSGTASPIIVRGYDTKEAPGGGSCIQALVIWDQKTCGENNFDFLYPP